MAKKYFYTAFLLACLFSFGAQAQENKQTFTSGKDPIEGLTIYPNPAKADRIYITTAKPAVTKDIEIFDMLTKKVMQVTLSGGNKELNISNLTRGIYMIKIKEGDAAATRKLVVE